MFFLFPTKVIFPFFLWGVFLAANGDTVLEEKSTITSDINSSSPSPADDTNALNRNITEADTSYSYADKPFIIRQRAIIKAFTHYRCISSFREKDDDFYYYAHHFNPLRHLNEYSNGSRVEAYVRMLGSGRALTRYEEFSFNDRPFAEFNELLPLLNDAFTQEDPYLFYKTLAYLSIRNNVISLYTAVSVLVSSMRIEGYRLPPAHEVSPQFYTPKDIIHQANGIDLQCTMNRRGLHIASRTGMSSPEERMAYFRDDAFLGTFHYYWHVDFPSWYNQTQYPANAKKHRKGELFLNAHHNIIMRYFAERISQGFPAIPEMDLSRPLFPGSRVNTLNMDYQDFPPRGPGVSARDIRIGEEVVIVDSVIQMAREIRNSIMDGYFVASNGSQISIRNDLGAEILGSALESAVISVNEQRYGSYHNLAHRLLSTVMDPDGSLQLPTGAVIHQETGLMDPIFYQLHFQVDNFYKLQKDYLTPYTRNERQLAGVRILELSVQTDSKNVPINELQTEFRNVSYDISNSVEESTDKCSKIKKAKVYGNLRQVNTRDFTFHLTVRNVLKMTRWGVVRIFMAPMESFNGSSPDTDTLRWSFFEMDRFPVKLNTGENTITRRSRDNSLAPSPSMPMHSLNEMVDRAYHYGESLKVDRSIRYCGWPNNYYLPIGRRENASRPMQYQLFAMISDFHQDYDLDFETVSKLKSQIMCTVVDGHVPDKRPMGFPFDRPIRSMDEFLTSNMKMIPVTVTHVD